MEDIIGLVCGCGTFAFFMMLGFFVGGANERRHFSDLRKREDLLRDMLQTQIKTFPFAAPSHLPPQMIVAEVVIASDYLKTFLSGLRKFFGGEMKSYQTMLVRARREAILRVLEQARSLGYNAICNLRLDSADIGGQAQSNRRGSAMASVIASATAYTAAIGQ